MKLKMTGLAVTAALALAVFAYAQPPGRGVRGVTATGTAPTPPVDAVKTYLTLTDSQITGFEAVRTTARTAAEPILTQLQAKRQALRAAMGANPVVAATIAALQTEINTLQAQLDKIQTGARDQMAALLSTEQKAKLATLTAAAALREEIQGASVIGLLEGGGPGFGGGRGKGGPGKGGPGGRGKGF